MRRFFLFALLVFSYALAQPIVGEGDSLTYEKDKIIYTGNVKLSRGNALLTADKVVLYLDENRRVKLMEAEGKARYVEGNRRAFADKMVYDLKNDVITLIGKARVEEGQNFVEADEIVYYRKEDRAIAISKGSRVRSFYVEEKDEKGRPNRKSQ
ncbi:MAG: lipopolysaccharide transport periplasmic protein LptA [Aquificaceae bacterium]